MSNNDVAGFPPEEFYNRVRNIVLCSDGGRVNNLGISIIIDEYEKHKAHQPTTEAKGVLNE